jgi:hypothetical protein
VRVCVCYHTRARFELEEVNEAGEDGWSDRRDSERFVLDFAVGPKQYKHTIRQLLL